MARTFGYVTITSKHDSGAENYMQDTKWLIVFDNVDNIELLREFWPVGQYGNVIITSRDPYLHTVDLGDLEKIKIQPLNQQESLSLFYKVAEKRTLSMAAFSTKCSQSGAGYQWPSTSWAFL